MTADTQLSLKIDEGMTFGLGGCWCAGYGTAWEKTPQSLKPAISIGLIGTTEEAAEKVGVSDGNGV